MVEKEESVPSGPGDGAGTEPASVMNVDAVAELANPPSKPTLGDAIALLEAKLAALGIVLQVPEVKSGSLKQMKVSGKLQSLPLLIHFAITFALDTTDHVTKDSVGKASEDWKKSLVPGNIVALHGTTSNTGFLRIENESVIGSARQYHGGHQQQHQALNHLKLENAAERFLVVDAGNGNIALYSPTNRRFLASKDGALVACGFPITGLDERPRANEMFQPSTPPPSAPQAQLLNASPSPFGGISSPSAFGGAAPAAAPGGFNFGKTLLFLELSMLLLARSF